MQTHQKPPETLQAQAANFAANLDNFDPDKEKIYAGLGNVAVLPETFARDPDMYQDYVKSLRETKRDDPDVIAKRAELANAFTEFAEPVTGLLASVDFRDDLKVKKHPAYLGWGSDSYVFRLNSGEQQYAVKVPRSRYEIEPRGKQLPAAEITDRYTIAAMRTDGVPHLEQVTAISYDKGVVIAEIMPGKDALKLTPEDLSAITDQQIKSLADTLILAEEAGVMVELFGKGNLFYDRGQGFGFIDCYSVDHPLAESLDYYSSRENVAGQVFLTLALTTNNKPELQQLRSDLYSRYMEIMEDEYIFRGEPAKTAAA